MNNEKLLWASYKLHMSTCFKCHQISPLFYETASATKVERKDLYNELEIMANVGHHPNLVNLIGACTQDGQ